MDGARTNWNDDRLDRLADQVDRLAGQVTALGKHMDDRFDWLQDRLDRLQYSMIITLASILAAFAAGLVGLR